MDHVQLRDLLKDRVGWDETTGFVLSTEAKKSDSGILFQDAHAFVKLGTIKDLQDDVNMNEAGFNAYLVKLKARNALQVISDVLQISNIQENILFDRDNIFDDAIAKRMAITVGDMILTSNRSNASERISKDQLQSIFFEINGNTSGSRYNPDMPMYVGLKDKYGAAVRKLQDLTQQVKTLDTFSHATPNYENNLNNDFIWYGK